MHFGLALSVLHDTAATHIEKSLDQPLAVAVHAYVAPGKGIGGTTNDQHTKQSEPICSYSQDVQH